MKFSKEILWGQQLAKQFGYNITPDGYAGDATKAVFEQILRETGRKRTGVESTEQSKLPWLEEAKKHKGLREIVGRMHNKTIQRWLRELGAWWSNDEVPWCATFIAYCLKQSGRPIPKHWYRAKAYEKYGTRLDKPHYGCVGVMSRKGGGHVCFIVGQTADGKYLVGLGGNQGNAVNLRKFPRSRFTEFRWADKAQGVPSKPFKSRANLPIYDNNLKLSRSES